MKRIAKERSRRKPDALFAVDLFAGGGGLSVGLVKAGFKVAAAVELEPTAVATYRANHPSVTVLDRDIRSIEAVDLAATVGGVGVALLAGCPPCQGFSSLTSKYKKPDPRNRLIEEMGRLVVALRPATIMMENVPGLPDKGSRYFNAFVRQLRAHGYRVNWKVLQVADYGVPQRRRRLVLLAGRGFDIPFPAPTHARVAKGARVQWRTVQDAIGNMKRPVILSSALRQGGPQKFNWHVVRKLSPKNVSRLRHARPGKGWTSIRKDLRPECHQEKDAGFSNVYGRMSWRAASPTITGGCTTLSKGRFGHPDKLRTISVREAATLQTFPSDYKITTSYMEAACDIVGNALPCDFAAVLAGACRDALRMHLGKSTASVLAR